MNIYLSIICIGLLIKLAVSYQLIHQFPSKHKNLKPEIFTFVAVFITYSIIQLFVFDFNGALLFGDLEYNHIIKIYYLLDDICLASGGALLMSMFGVNVRTKAGFLLVVAVLISGHSYFLFSHAATGQLAPLSLTTPYNGGFLIISRTVILITSLIILISLVRSYRSAKENSAQIKKIYALIACCVFAANCLYGSLETVPALLALRGIVFYVVIIAILRSERLFDIRPATPATLENESMREFKQLFRHYTNENIDLKTMMIKVESEMLQYKLKKVPQFNNESGSVLPEVAKNMGISLGSLYALLDKHSLEKPPKKRND